jgi:hypothetical protein
MQQYKKDTSSLVSLVSFFFAWQRPTLAEKPQLPLALKSLTSVFGMGTGVTSSLLSPEAPRRFHFCSPHKI